MCIRDRLTYTRMLYLRCRWQDMLMAALRLELCIADVSHWMAANRLKLNPYKTELLWAGSRSTGQQEATNYSSERRPSQLVITCAYSVSPSRQISARRNTSLTNSTCFYWLHQLRRISRSLDTESAKTLVHTFITSPVDYCNTMLGRSPNTPLSTADRLQ